MTKSFGKAREDEHTPKILQRGRIGWEKGQGSGERNVTGEPSGERGTGGR